VRATDNDTGEDDVTENDDEVEDTPETPETKPDGFTNNPFDKVEPPAAP
jgi:hypothetical protein